MQVSTDSINWPPEFSDLKRLDVILKCGICYDFMNNCMITSCSHTYCSLCIRKFMQYKNQCPTCYEETFEINLRNNRLLDEVILIYTKIRDKLLRASRLASVTVPVKYEPKERKSESKESPPVSNANASSNGDEVKEKVVDVEKLTSPSKKEENKPFLKLSAKDGDSVIVNGVKVPGMFTSPKMSSARPRRPEELTSCPVCQVKVPARNINIHLDSCLALDPAAKPKPKVRKRSPLPKRVYTMMPEKNLKRFLKEYGLSTSGDRKTMINRLQRYTVIYNAENDATTPRPVSELINQLEREEREEKKPNSIMKNMHNPTPRPAVPKNDVEAIEKANKAYCDENRASFMKLIEEMRARDGRNIKPLKPSNRIYSDDEDDPNKVDSSICDNMPTTSGCASAKGAQSSLNRKKNDTAGKSINIDSDSDGDIFLSSDTEDKVVKGKIDWNKTAVTTTEDGTQNSIYDLITQKPIAEIDITSDGDNELVEKNNLSSVQEPNENSNDSLLSTDYGDSSDGSVCFGTSRVKADKSAKKKNENKLRKMPRRRLSLSWKKSTKSDDLADGQTSVIEEETSPSKEDSAENDYSINGINIDDKNFDEELSDKEADKNDVSNSSEYEDGEFNGFENISKTSELIAEASELNDETINEEMSGDSYGKDDKTIEETPLKRLTRSAKRKSMSNQENKSDEEETLATPLIRKRTKRELQDTSPEI